MMGKLNNEYLASLAYEKHGIKNTILDPFLGMDQIKI